MEYKQAIKALEDKAKDKLTFREWVDEFLRMCEIPIDGFIAEEEACLLEYGGWALPDYVSIVRQGQMEGDDEYIQLRLELHFPKERMDPFAYRCLWSDEDDVPFRDVLRNDPLYLALKDEVPLKVEAFADLT